VIRKANRQRKPASSEFTSVVEGPRFVLNRGEETAYRLRLAEFQAGTQSLGFGGLGVSGHIDPAVVITGLQASKLLEEEDAVFKARKPIEPLRSNWEGVSETERNKQELAYTIKYYDRPWFRVDANSCRWEDIRLWGKYVREVDPRNHPQVRTQPTKSGMVEQWRALVSLAIRFRESIDIAKDDEFIRSNTGFVCLTKPGPVHDKANIFLGGAGEHVFLATFSRTLVDFQKADDRYAGDNRVGSWQNFTWKRDANGEIVTSADGRREVGETWEQTHQSTYAGSAVLAWAFAQRRLQKIYDACSPFFRLQMSATAECLVGLGPILGWGPNDFAVVERAEREVIAIAPQLIKPATSTLTVEPPRGQPRWVTVSQLKAVAKRVLKSESDWSDSWGRVREAAGVIVPRGRKNHSLSPEEVVRCVSVVSQVIAFGGTDIANAWRDDFL
jgi:hypothetical protein